MSTATSGASTAEHVDPIDVAATQRLATAVRMLAADMVDAADSGHPGLPLGAADVATVLFTRHLVFDAADPAWPDRDRFVLSAGHGSALLYALGYLCGVAGVRLDHLRRFRRLGSPCAGHPEHGEFPIADTTTGPLGQGIANAVGMAIAEERLRHDFGNDLCDHHTWVLAGDGCLMEGVTAEAIALAGHLRLRRLVLLWDDNRITIDGPTAQSTTEDQLARFAAAGWTVASVDGHDPLEIDAALTAAREATRPTLVACRTTIGKGAPTKAGIAAVHGSPLGAAERAAMADRLDWGHPPFEIPADLHAEWRAAGTRSRGRREHWTQNIASHPLGPALSSRLADPTPSGTVRLATLRTDLLATLPTVATRAINATVIDALDADTARSGRDDGSGSLLGGSADLAGSNGFGFARRRPFTAADRGGNFVNYGIREHAMAAATNGIALHGGFRPYAGTFLAFSDYSRPAIRLAALMRLGVVHVFTHDSIGVGEDGPTHQPVEHVCALRAIPGLVVIRPADAVETVEAWQFALSSDDRPTALVLTRQAVAPLDRHERAPDGVAAGGYVVAEPSEASVTLLASGSEVGIAVGAAQILASDGIAARIVSMPSMELFADRPTAERDAVLGELPRIAVEATIGQSWQRWLRPGDTFVGMSGFGASAPGPDLFEHFGITPTAVAEAGRAALPPPVTRQGAH